MCGTSVFLSVRVRERVLVGVCVCTFVCYVGTCVYVHTSAYVLCVGICT